MTLREIINPICKGEMTIAGCDNCAFKSECDQAIQAVKDRVREVMLKEKTHDYMQYHQNILKGNCSQCVKDKSYNQAVSEMDKKVEGL